MKLFDEEGYVRKRCGSCGRNFWTVNLQEKHCGDQPCVAYTFIENPPTRRSYDMSEVRELFLSFFEKRGHRRIGKYPVVARWRDDVYFVGASIFDFQPWVTDGMIPPPANPLVISQPCVRFTDVDLVGRSGRHLTEFEMMAHHAFNRPEKFVYWTDETASYCFEFLTKELGIKPEDINFIEDMWSGGGNAGEDLEVVVKGMEVATLVFMHYKTVNGNLNPIKNETVDTGYGLERLVWLTKGSPTIYDAVFEPVVQRLCKLSGYRFPDRRLLVETSKWAGLLELKGEKSLRNLRSKIAERVGISPEELERTVTPMETMYTVADFTRTLVFMLGDGIVPSNAEAGYLARLLIRRVLRGLRNMGLETPLEEVLAFQVEEASKDFPEYREKSKTLYEIARVEEARYDETLKRGRSLVEKMVNAEKARGSSTLSTTSLVQLYDSHGLTPDYVSVVAGQLGFETGVPDDFYSRVAKLHEARAKTGVGETWASKIGKDVEGLQPTDALYYLDPYLREFEATVLTTLNGRYVVLDRTAFYPEGGGQPADKGVLRWKHGEARVEDVQKIGNVIVHALDGDVPKKGERVTCILDWDRRLSLMKHHTATHLLIGAARRVLGEHVWQSGAMKDVEKSRLDVSHYLKLTDEQAYQIETLANRVVMDNTPVETFWMPREEAESRYGFRIYQGGVVPGKEIRIVKAGDWEVEACAGTHCKTTGEIGLIKIVRTERIQDGVERIFFSAGIPALQHTQSLEMRLKSTARIVSCPVEDLEKNVGTLIDQNRSSRKELDRLKGKFASIMASMLLKDVKRVGHVKLLKFKSETDVMDVDTAIKTCSELVKADRKLVTVFIIVNGKAAKIVVMAGEEAVELGVDAGKLSASVAEAAGGSGGGKPNFGQGGSTHPEKASKALDDVEKNLGEQLGKRA